jgi:phosphatidylethanolamine-binding protein (PEBP) family uncharacterized protein
MRVSSPAFPDGGTMPVRFANVGVAGGANDSIPLAWEGEPDATRSYVIAVVDHHPVAHGWVHWLVTDIPASAHAVDQGASGRAIPAGANEMLNTGGGPAMEAPSRPQAPELMTTSRPSSHWTQLDWRSAPWPTGGPCRRRCEVTCSRRRR